MTRPSVLNSLSPKLSIHFFSDFFVELSNTRTRILIKFEKQLFSRSILEETLGMLSEKRIWRNVFFSSFFFVFVLLFCVHSWLALRFSLAFSYNVPPINTEQLNLSMSTFWLMYVAGINTIWIFHITECLFNVNMF